MKYSYLENYFPAIPVLQVRLAFPEQAFNIGPVNAIVDTGADGTLIPQTILDQLGASLVDQIRVRSHWGEWRTMKIYTVDIEVANMRLPVVEAAGDPGQEIILGRNVLNRLKLVLDSPSKQTTIVD